MDSTIMFFEAIDQIPTPSQLQKKYEDRLNGSVPQKPALELKWELVGIHAGRCAFIVNVLSLGITPNIVMKWTGHSDYKAMKPYIDIVDSIKAGEMTKLNMLVSGSFNQ